VADSLYDCLWFPTSVVCGRGLPTIRTGCPLFRCSAVVVGREMCAFIVRSSLHCPRRLASEACPPHTVLRRGRPGAALVWGPPGGWGLSVCFYSPHVMLGRRGAVPDAPLQAGRTQSRLLCFAPGAVSPTPRPAGPLVIAPDDVAASVRDRGFGVGTNGRPESRVWESRVKEARIHAPFAVDESGGPFASPQGACGGCLVRKGPVALVDWRKNRLA